MILHTRTRVRPGITLLEVLTAIFIMGVGLLAILTLFPLGALNMARAVREDRAAAAGANAASFATAIDLRNDPLVVMHLSSAPGGFLPPDPNGPGYPVLIDPLYYQYGSLSIPTTGVRRSTASIITTVPTAAQQKQAINRWFSFQDEITFEKWGEPTGSPTAVTRPGTYSWVYLMRRPRSNSASLTEMSVIVFASRDTSSVSGETVLTATVQGASTLSVTYSGDKPNVRKGSWILDATYQEIDRTTGQPVAIGTNPNNFGRVNGQFYQVAAVTDTSATTMTLELESSLKGNATTIVLLENVITVMDRGTTWKP